MVKKIFKWIGKAVLTVTVLALLGYTYIYFNIENRLDKTYDVTVKVFTIPTDSSAIASGKHLSIIKGCNECHGENLVGKVLSDNAMMGRLSAANLTSGKGGIGTSFTTYDWIMALQHGLNKDRKPLLLMPSHETAQLSQSDMAAVIAYCRSAKPVDNELPENNIAFMARIFGYLDKFVLIPAEKIDHSAKLKQAPDTTSLVAYGKYLSVSCQGCHRPDMKGGDPIIPGGPAVPDLTAGGATGKWTYQQFTQILRIGKRPDGYQINNDNMPWKMTAAYSQKEIQALYEFLKSNK